MNSTKKLLTEARNPRTMDIDTLPTLEMVRLINAEDAQVATAIQETLPQIAEAIDAIAERMKKGGRLIYIGAGTSGRLGVLDASECPPTFNTPPEMVVGLIAGGLPALTDAVEAAEDRPEAGERDLMEIEINAKDALVGIAASGRTPYVLGALAHAKKQGALTVSLTCNHPSPMADAVDIAIAAVVGPEVLTGSTRLKAGTAQKLVLNMLSTGTMVRLGKTYGNLMVDVAQHNVKLQERAERIVAQACDVGDETAAAALTDADRDIRAAIVRLELGCEPDTAKEKLDAAKGDIRLAISS
ncbi:MAG: N-acetylmuramic acid 6-phosphate etherase [Chloroflexi bacterium]|nr:N-acetylmuramic acid 6-phosphate etherase [Chloroflexota bacterium]